MKNIPISLVVVFILLSSILSIVDSSEISNNIVYVDDDGGADYTRIQDAIDNASDGDTIFVYNGTYYGKIIINKSITLIGENNTNTIIKPDNPEESAQLNRIITIYSDNVQVKNLCLRPYNNIKMYNTRPIYAKNSRNLIIQNNNIINCNGRIIFDTNTSAEILDNHIHSYNGFPARCIYFINPPLDSTIKISRNSIINYGTGIDFNFYETAPSQIIIYNNHIEFPFGQHSSNNFDSGISFSHTVDTNYHLNISHNNITGFTFGFYFSGSGIPLDNSSIHIFLNSFYNEKSDLYLLPNSKRSNEPLIVTNNNFFGENKQELFIENIILDPFMIPFLLNYSMGLIQKNSIEWSSNYWHHHYTLLPKLIPGIMIIYLQFPFIGIVFNIFKIDVSPATEPYDI